VIIKGQIHNLTAMQNTYWGKRFTQRLVQFGCDRTAQNNSVLSPKPVHLAIKQ
jgi:hypothetical protein